PSARSYTANLVPGMAPDSSHQSAVWISSQVDDNKLRFFREGLMNYWWLGFNTKPRQNDDQGIYLDQALQVFLEGHEEKYRWPTIGTNDSHQRYSTMQKNDRVVLW